MGKEDQAEEIEILESIYPEELEIHDETTLSIHLKLETDPARQLLVDIEYPETYPEESIPLIMIEPEATEEEARLAEAETQQDQKKSNVTIDSSVGEPKFTYSFTKADCQQLVQQAREVATENLGIPSVFTIISMVKENAEELYESRIRDQEAERLKQLHLEEEKEQAKFRGTPVTKESFNAWRTKFRAEMGWDKPKVRPFGRFTGREIFDKGMYQEGEEDDEDDAEEDGQEKDKEQE